MVVNDAQASLTVVLAANRPWACRLGVSFFSASLLLPGASVEFFGSFLTHLIGLSERELSCAAAAAPLPAGPCAAARSAPTVKEIDTPKSKTAPTKSVFLIRTPSLKRPDKNGLPDAASHLVGHSAVSAQNRCSKVLPQSVTLVVRT